MALDGRNLNSYTDDHDESAQYHGASASNLVSKTKDEDRSDEAAYLINSGDESLPRSIIVCLGEI